MTAVGGQVWWADDITVAYAAQKAWLLNDTVKNNILFGQPYIRERYEAILEACALKSDLEILPAGKELYSSAPVVLVVRREKRIFVLGAEPGDKNFRRPTEYFCAKSVCA